MGALLWPVMTRQKTSVAPLVGTHTNFEKGFFLLIESRYRCISVVERARSAGLRHYLIESALQDAALAVAVKRAASSPL
jgi:hypothetical protein